MKAAEYLSPEDLLSSRIDCMIKQDEELIPKWWTEVQRRMKLEKEYVTKHGRTDKVPMVKKCPDCSAEGEFPKHLIKACDNPVIVRCQDCQDIFNDAEHERFSKEKKQMEEQKNMLEASEREKNFFKTLPSHILDEIEPMDISGFKSYGYRCQLNDNIDKLGYSILLSYFMDGMDKVELISHVDLVNKIRSADKDIAGISEFYKSRELLIITDFNSSIDSANSKVQVKNIILNRSFAKAKTFIIFGRNAKSTTEINFFEKFKGEM